MAWLLLALLRAVALEPLFEADLDSCSYGGGAVGDLDEDGTPEVLFGTYYNDERVVALHHDGTPLWTIPSGGGPVDNSVTAVDLDGDGSLEVLWGNSQTTVFHVADATGTDVWTATIGEVLDAPEAIGDLDGDGALDIVLASCGTSAPGAGLRAFTAAGEVRWRAAVGGCYQSAPLLFDQDGDGLLDVVVSTWFDDKVRAFSGRDGSLRWEATIGDWTYHAGSFGDLSGDGVPDVALGDYSATLWALDGATGDLLWSARLEGETYIFGPTAMGDLDGDGALEVVVTGRRAHVFDAAGGPVRAWDLPGYCPRGPILADLDGDALPDVLTAVDGPIMAGWSGLDGRELFAESLGGPADMDFHPAVWDLDGDLENEVFAVYGRGWSDPDPEANWGRAVALHLGVMGRGWPTFSHDHHHSGNFEVPPGHLVNVPGAGGAESCGCRTGVRGPWLLALAALGWRRRSRGLRGPGRAPHLHPGLAPHQLPHCDAAQDSVLVGRVQRGGDRPCVRGVGPGPTDEHRDLAGGAAEVALRVEEQGGDVQEGHPVVGTLAEPFPSQVGAVDVGVVERAAGGVRGDHRDHEVGAGRDHRLVVRVGLQRQPGGAVPFHQQQIRHARVQEAVEVGGRKAEQLVVGAHRAGEGSVTGLRRQRP